MDNLAHSFTAGIVSAALLPETTRHYRRRMMLSSVLIANLPDADFIMTLLGREFYLFHHRGLTHSLFGLFFMLPLCVLIFSRIMAPALSAPEAAGGVTRREVWFFVVVQLLFTHFFLDYLTSYGTMLLFPLSRTRFSWPLMFIIDPWFWLISGSVFLFLCLKRAESRRSMLIPAWSGLALIFLLWSVEAGFKWDAESRFQERQAASCTEAASSVRTYPGPLAPFFWLMVGENRCGESTVLSQAALSWIAPEQNSLFYWQEAVPEGYHHQRFCPGDGFSTESAGLFENYAGWADPFVCRADVINGVPGCRCLSLKYSLAAVDVVAYGGWWVSNDGSMHGFLPSDPLEDLLRYYRLFLPIPDSSGS